MAFSYVCIGSSFLNSVFIVAMLLLLDLFTFGVEVKGTVFVL
jgi:hypothetical protein